MIHCKEDAGSPVEPTKRAGRYVWCHAK